jgi:hypothetical protein
MAPAPVSTDTPGQTETTIQTEVTTSAASSDVFYNADLHTPSLVGGNKPVEVPTPFTPAKEDVVEPVAKRDDTQMEGMAEAKASVQPTEAEPVQPAAGDEAAQGTSEAPAQTAQEGILTALVAEALATEASAGKVTVAKEDVAMTDAKSNSDLSMQSHATDLFAQAASEAQKARTVYPKTTGQIRYPIERTSGGGGSGRSRKKRKATEPEPDEEGCPDCSDYTQHNSLDGCSGSRSSYYSSRSRGKWNFSPLL